MMNWKNDIHIKEIQQSALSNSEIHKLNTSIKEQLLSDYKNSKKNVSYTAFKNLLFTSCLWTGFIGAIFLGIGFSMPREIQPPNDFSKIASVQISSQNVNENSSDQYMEKIEKKLETVDPRLAAHMKVLEDAKKVFFEQMLETKKMADKVIEENKKK